jgi:hypothetical protein
MNSDGCGGAFRLNIGVESPLAEVGECRRPMPPVLAGSMGCRIIREQSKGEAECQLNAPNDRRHGWNCEIHSRTWP